MTLSALTFESWVRMSSWMPSTKKASSCLAAAVLEGQDGDRGACILYPGRCVRLNRACRGGCILPGFARALVVPERPAAEQQEQREDRELGGA